MASKLKSGKKVYKVNLENKIVDLTQNEITTGDLVVNFSENPRKQYFETIESWLEFKNSLKENGQEMPITVKSMGDGKYKVVHGFRRTRGILELINEGNDIPIIYAFASRDNEEEILLKHISGNSGKPLTDIEMSDIILKLQKYGYTIEKIARKTGYTKNKVVFLLNYQKNTSQKVKDAVEKDIISITAANNLASGSLSIDDQNKKLEELKTETDGKISVSSVKKKTKKGIVKLKTDDELYPISIALDEVFGIEDADNGKLLEFIDCLVGYGLNIKKI